MWRDYIPVTDTPPPHFPWKETNLLSSEAAKFRQRNPLEPSCSEKSNQKEWWCQPENQSLSPKTNNPTDKSVGSELQIDFLSYHRTQKEIQGMPFPLSQHALVRFYFSRSCFWGNNLCPWELTSLLGTHTGVPSLTKPASTDTPTTMGSRELNTYWGRTRSLQGNTAICLNSSCLFFLRSSLNAMNLSNKW